MYYLNLYVWCENNHLRLNIEVKPENYRRATSSFSMPLLVCLSVFLSSAAYSQQDDEVVRVNTDLVILNITVTDASGQYVPGLRLSDFKVFEDGKEVPSQVVSSFSVHESPFASVLLLDTSGSMEVRLSLPAPRRFDFLTGCVMKMSPPSTTLIQR